MLGICITHDTQIVNEELLIINITQMVYPLSLLHFFYLVTLQFSK